MSTWSTGRLALFSAAMFLLIAAAWLIDQPLLTAIAGLAVGRNGAYVLEREVLFGPKARAETSGVAGKEMSRA